MQLQMKIFLFCSSMVLLSEAAQTTTTPATSDIIVDKCNGGKISVIPYKKGTYFQCTDLATFTGCTEKGVFDNKGNGFDIDKAQGQDTFLIRFDVVSKILISTAQYDKYTVNCHSAKKVKATGSMDVKPNFSGKDSTADKKINDNVDMKFTPSNKVMLGESITMTLEENVQKKAVATIAKIKVIKCDVFENGGNKIPIYEQITKGKELNIKVKEGKTTTLEFKAFRLINQKDDKLTFKCDIWICTDAADCTIPKNKPHGPVSPQLYEASQGGDLDNIAGVLSVRIPQYIGANTIPNSADKVCSYTNGFLLTVGAVVLQRQLVRN